MPKLTELHINGRTYALQTDADESLLRVLRDRLARGIVITKYHHVDRRLDERLRTVEAAHPLPDENSVKATRDLAALHEGGESVNALLHQDWLRIDNGALKRACPPGVQACAAKWRNSR